MKRILVVLAMVPMFASAADLTPGTIQITGDSNLGFASGSEKMKGAEESTKTTDLGLNLTGLYTVIPNLGVGLQVGYALASEKTGDFKASNTALFVGPAIGYDYPVAEKANLFALASVGFASGKATEEVPGFEKQEEKVSGYGFNVGVGAKYFLAKSFSLNGAVGYDYAKITGEAPEGGGDKPEFTNSGFGFNVGLSVYFDALGK